MSSRSEDASRSVVEKNAREPSAEASKSRHRIETSQASRAALPPMPGAPAEISSAGADAAHADAGVARATAIAKMEAAARPRRITSLPFCKQREATGPGRSAQTRTGERAL